MMTPTMAAQTSAASTQSPIKSPLQSPVESSGQSQDLLDQPLLGAASEWHQEQFERHLRYARSLGLSPDHARRFALQQLQTAKAHRAASRASQ